MCIIVANNDISRVRLLIDAGFPLSLGDYDGRTPLHIAASLGFKNIAKLLIDAGADA
jgi:ankyrin repeat protein